MKMSTYAHGQFSWVDLMALDMEKAKAFYGDLFGWRVEEQDVDGDQAYGMVFQDDDVVAGFGEMNEEMKAQGVGAAWNSYVAVDDIDAAVTDAEAAGATITFPATQVLEAGWLAYLQDPTGAPLGLWQAGQHDGASLVNEPCSFCWNELNTRDAGVAKQFFSEFLGWEYAANDSSPNEYYIIKNEGRSNGGILQMTEEWGDISPHWMVYFAVDDVDRISEKVNNLGGRLLHGPFGTDIGRMAVVADPDGAVFHVINLNNNVAG